jgi:integrase
MAIRKIVRPGKSAPVLCIDIRYRDASGRKRRYRRDAQVQTAAGARAEERRLLAYLGEHGELPQPIEEAPKTQAPAEKPSTFGDAVERFEESVLLLKKPSTRSSYQELLHSDALAQLLDKPLAEVDLGALVDVDVKLVKASVSSSRRRNFHVVVRSVLRAAVAEGRLAEMPKLPRLPRVGRAVVAAFPAAELPKVLAVASPSARLAIALAAYAGLRAGEVRGLRWGDVNLATRTLVVRRAITRREEAAPKSGHERLIPIAAPLLELLRASSSKDLTAPVAPTAHGKVWGESGLRQAFARACKRAGVGAHRFHALRHAFVTELFRRGAPAPAVQALAGHASLAVTERYAHVAERDLRSAIAALGQ